MGSRKDERITRRDPVRQQVCEVRESFSYNNNNNNMYMYMLHVVVVHVHVHDMHF